MSDFDRLRELVSRAMELSPDQRDAYLQENCSDPALLAEAQQLLAHDALSREGLTDAVNANVVSEAAGVFESRGRPVEVSGYQVLETLGAGGMGVIYRARQLGALDREVALKLIRPGFDSAKVVGRFELERRALARMEHPNIAQVFDAGATDDGLPWFAMEIVEGEPIHEWCNERGLDLDARLQLFEGVCRGVQHAHQKGIIHRDLKPTNILVTMRDGRAIPKIIDFGISKALGDLGEDASMVTVNGQLLGTPEYMSPEQLRGEAEDVDIRTDVYSMGVLLYHLLSGTLPFDRPSLVRASLSSESTESDPPRPSRRVTGPAADTETISRQRATQPRQLRRQLSGDLDWITLKALALDPEKRYTTVQGLLNDIERHRQGHPVSAGPPTARYRMGKFVQRHRTAIGVIALLILTLTAGLLESNRQRIRAQAARVEADSVTEFLSEMLASVRADEMGRDVTVQAVLDRASESLSDELGDQDLVRARLLTTIGRTYLALGKTENALERLAEAFAIRRGELGTKSPQTLESRYHHAVALRDHGDVEASIAEFEEVLSLRRKVLGSEHVHTLGTLTDLGASRQQNGDTELARRAFEEAYAGFRRTRGPRDPDTVNAAMNLGNLLAESGEFAAAEPLLKGSLDICREELGPHHPETLSALQSMALLHYDRGETEACERLLTEVLEGNRRLHGENHPETLQSMVNLASIRSNVGMTESAVELLEEALPHCRATLGDDHRITLTCMNNLAWAYGQQGRDEEAESLLEETVATRKRVRGKDHLFTLVSWNNLGELYARTGRPAEGEAVHREVLRRRRASLGEDHPHVMISMTNLATALRELGRYGEAAELYESSWQKQRDLLGANHPDAILTATETARLYELRNDPAQAEHWRARASKTPDP